MTFKWDNDDVTDDEFTEFIISLRILEAINKISPLFAIKINCEISFQIQLTRFRDQPSDLSAIDKKLIQFPLFG